LTTDRQTDGREMTYGEREREFTLRSRSLKTGSALPISDN